jgi:hypothetical protein
MSLVGALNKIAKANKAGTAVVKTAPFYSAVDEALVNLARQKGTGAEFLREVSKTLGVKPAELTHRKLDKILQAQGKITKDDVLKLARENPPAGLYENVSQDLTDKQLTKAADEIAQDFGYDNYYSLPRDLQRQADDKLEAMGSKYGQYQFPGGENYREIKMKLPSFTKEDSDRMMELEAYKRRASYPEQWGKMTGEDQELKDLMNRKAALSDPYLSSHWKDEPNVLAHMRVSDRAGPDGQKILHVEEIQSDWHQAGRSKGYKGKGTLTELPYNYFVQEIKTIDGDTIYVVRNKENPSVVLNKDHNKQNAIDSFINELNAKSDGVPDAPFKKNWHELAMKRLLNYAADNGYDSIAITPGAEQAKRYDLSKQINTISWNKQNNGLYGIEADAVNGRPIIKKGLTEQELEDTVGKEIASKIVNGAGQFASDPLFDSGKLTRGRLENLDLQVGGEGMKGFYDQMLPAYLNQYGKKYGAEVGAIPLNTPKNEPWNIEDAAKFHGMTGTEYLDNPNRPELEKQFLQERNKATTQLHHFPITPEMREEIANKGFPLYQKGGPVNIEQEYKLKKFRK